MPFATQSFQFQTALENASETEIASLDKKFRDTFLHFGSQTNDSVSCTKCVQVGIVEDGTGLRRSVVGFQLASNGPSLSTMFNSAEGGRIPDQLLDDIPDVT